MEPIGQKAKQKKGKLKKVFNQFSFYENLFIYLYLHHHFSIFRKDKNESNLFQVFLLTSFNNCTFYNNINYFYALLYLSS